ncbi:MAG TPA: MFS transporter [Vicinamibacterales bacterium]|jgi:predicted MFS family arabinose efflux permease|nr:MFS transporter [Vicinamibacterales bacterium]
MRRPPTFPIVLAGFAAFLDLYSTQPILPLLTRVFGTSSLGVSLTITAPTIAVAIAAPFAGRFADRVGPRSVIVGSAFMLAVATLFAATSQTLTQLILWRFVQGLATPGVFATAMAYIHEEWPATRVGRGTAAYMSGTVVGGFTGRAITGVVASHWSWRWSFVALGLVSAVVAGVLSLWLPVERRAHHRDTLARRPAQALFKNPQLAATFAVGFCVLCAQVAMFTYVPFPLSAPPFNLSTAALGWIFSVYLLGAIVTPFSGRWIDVHGPRVALAAAVSMGVSGALLTLSHSLPLVIVGLSVFATGVFVSQASATSHVGANAGDDRGLAIGLYSTFYYLGGSTGGALPALAWSRAGWPGCVALVIGVQFVTLATAFAAWTPRTGTHAEPTPV